MNDLLCPHCNEPTEDYGEHVTRDEMTGDPEYPIHWLTRWVHESGDEGCTHIHAERFKRTKPVSEFKSIQQVRWGIKGTLVCWACEAVMPESLCRAAR